MPGILMDNGLGDLFEDGASTIRGLHEQIDLLRQGGCKQRIAWGKLGCIAAISANGADVEVRHMMASAKDGSWVLSPKHTFKNIHGGAQLASVHWNVVGSDLAVIDIYGRLAIWTVYVSVDRLNNTRQTQVTTKDDLSMLAGFWWMNVGKTSGQSNYTLGKAAIKKDGQYQYPNNTLPQMGPINPLQTKNACLGVTKNGVVKLWYASDTQSHIQKVTADLESYTSMDDIITHATFSPDRDKSAILAVYTQSKQLRVYRVEIDWHVPPIPAGQILTQLPILATIHVKRLKIEHCPGDGQDTASSFLTHLEILSPFPGPHSYAPVVMAFFVSTAQGQYLTTIKRWELRHIPSGLHTAFNQLAERRNSVVKEKERFELVPQTDVVLNKCALSITHLNGSTVVGITYSDGTFELRDRVNLSAMRPTNNYDKLINMIHAGWQFPHLGPYTDIALSPNYSAAALLTKENDVNLVLMTFRDPLEGTVEENPNILIAAVTLAQHHAWSSFNHTNNDDLVATARQYNNPHLKTCLLLEAHRALQQNIDFLNEQSTEKIQRSPFFLRCLSLQSALYFQGWNQPKAIPAKISQATLNLKATSVGFGYFMNNVNRMQRPELEPPDYKANALQNLIGVVKWEIDFHVFIVDELLELVRRVRSKPRDMEFVKKTILEMNSCALPLVIGGASRFLLKYNSRALRGFDSAARDNLASNSVDEPLRQGYQSLHTIMDTNPIKSNLFEKLLVDIITGIRQITEEWDAARRIEVDRMISLTGDIPEVFYPVVDGFLHQTLALLKNDIDPSSIFFYDTTWLGFSDDRKSVEFKKSSKVDTFRKSLLKKGTPTRRCLRCAEVVEDLVPSVRMGVWLQNVSRVCVCGSLWMHDDQTERK